MRGRNTIKEPCHKVLLEKPVLVQVESDEPAVQKYIDVTQLAIVMEKEKKKIHQSI